MDAENSAHDLSRLKTSASLSHDVELEEMADDEHERSSPEQRNAERILRLIHLLSVNECTQISIFERLRDYYPLDAESDDIGRTTRTAYQMLRRDLLFLENMGYEIKKKQDTGGTTRYTLLEGSGPVSPLLFKQEELAILATLYTLFIDPNRQSSIDVKQPLSAQVLRHPFAQDMLQLIERLTVALSPQQKSYFEQCVQKPLIYFNLEAVTDYIPHRATIDTIVQAISRRQQLYFEYGSTPFPRNLTTHGQVDPYYLIQQDGHIYLVGYSHDTSNPRKNRIFEWRVDRIKAESIKLQPDTVSSVHRPRPITFRYWADISIAKSGLSQRWITHEIEREETVGEGRQQRRRLLVRAQAYNDWRIIQQLHKYGDKVELIAPPELLKQMRQEVKRMYDLYFQSGQDTP
ncbi:MAG: helix-turn-helix transcriptional regulator [Ktedonobacteraceae bacterium]